MIRRMQPDDLAAVKIVIDASGLFPSALLDDMIAEYFSEPTGSGRCYAAAPCTFATALRV